MLLSLGEGGFFFKHRHHAKNTTLNYFLFCTYCDGSSCSKGSVRVCVNVWAWRGFFFERGDFSFKHPDIAQRTRHWDYFPFVIRTTKGKKVFWVLCECLGLGEEFFLRGKNLFFLLGYYLFSFAWSSANERLVLFLFLFHYLVVGGDGGKGPCSRRFIVLWTRDNAFLPVFVSFSLLDLL